LDLPALLAKHRDRGADVTLHLLQVADPRAFGCVPTDAAGWVTAFLEKTADPPTNQINAGCYVFSREMLESIPAGQVVSVERDTFPRLVAESRLAAVATDDYWLDAGRPELYLRANLDLISGARRRPAGEAAVAAGAIVHETAQVVDSVVADGVVVGAGSVVRGSLLLAGARVGGEASVVDSIVAGGVGASASVESAVIGAGEAVPAGSELRGMMGR